MSVTNRTSPGDGPTYDLTHVLKTNAAYTATCFFNHPTATRVRFALGTIANGAETWEYSNWETIGTCWQEVSATVSTNWSGVLGKAAIKLETDTADPVSDFFFDNVSMVEQGTSKRLTHCVLSQGTSPFGATNSDGIYLIDCQGQDLLIEHCRIRATLLIRNYASLVVGTGPILWEPPARGAVTLLADATVDFRAAATGLPST